MRRYWLGLVLSTLISIGLFGCGGDDRPGGGDAGAADAATSDGGLDGATGADGGLDGATDGATDATTDGTTDAGPTCSPEVSWEACHDGLDNDCDGEIDAYGPLFGCSLCPPETDAASAADETGLCADGIDNDCDGYPDCADFSCAGDPACLAEDTDALCSDGLDNDGDGRIDCGERSCAGPGLTVCAAATTEPETSAALCSDGLDNDADGRIDCDDADCDALGGCTTGFEGEDTISCTDGIDNDGDGRTDCTDSDCAVDPACVGEDDDASCSDALDNDADGRIDCADPSCYANPSVTVCLSANEICDNTLDDDFDGLADCLDPECAGSCSALPCSIDNPVGSCAGAGMQCGEGGACGMPLSAFDLATEATLLITELMPNPGAVTDGNGEFVEILNVSGGPLLLEGLEISDATLAAAGSVETFTRRLVVDPDATFVLAANDDPAANGGITAVGMFSFSLTNGGDTISLLYGGAPIHSITYPGAATDLTNTGTASVVNQSLQLDAIYLADRAAGTPRWCLTPMDAAYGYDVGATSTDYGTPGAANVVCP
ncbi:MAG: lamin tail domain-containing protein [Myxococcales bacterium]|nr:lamin tail domain-containing protein [Myxococcales bacterium]